jgi:hypothetical protein
MSTRKSFLAAAAAVPLVAAAPPSAQPAPTPTPSPKPSKISPAARALAERMRAFDPQLTDKNVEAIAGGIDANLKLGKTVNPHGTLLKNWDEPFCHPVTTDD